MVEDSWEVGWDGVCERGARTEGTSIVEEEEAGARVVAIDWEKGE